MLAEFLLDRESLNHIEMYGLFRGGRMLYREDLSSAARRIAQEYGLEFKRLHLVGVFPVSFPNRSDVTVVLAALTVSGEPTLTDTNSQALCG
jgi:hypothetical protein